MKIWSRNFVEISICADITNLCVSYVAFGLLMAILIIFLFQKVTISAKPDKNLTKTLNILSKQSKPHFSNLRRAIDSSDVECLHYQVIYYFNRFLRSSKQHNCAVGLNKSFVLI